MYIILITNISKQTTVQLNTEPLEYKEAVKLLSLYRECGFETKSLVKV